MIHPTFGNNNDTTARSLGEQDAREGRPCVPEMYFLHTDACLDYAQAYARIARTEAALAVIAHYSAIELRIAFRLAQCLSRQNAPSLEKRLRDGIAAADARIEANKAVLSGWGLE